jgi:hypothetical protein
MDDAQPAEPESTESSADFLTSIRWENFFSLRRMGEGLVGALVAAYLLRNVSWGTDAALAVGLVVYVASSALNRSPLDRPYCGKAVKHNAEVCHHCGRVVTE